MSDLVDEFRNWEQTHNRDNYGRFDAFKAGHDLTYLVLEQKLAEALKIMDHMHDDIIGGGWHSLNEYESFIEKVRSDNGYLSGKA